MPLPLPVRSTLNAAMSLKIPVPLLAVFLWVKPLPAAPVDTSLIESVVSAAGSMSRNGASLDFL